MIDELEALVGHIFMVGGRAISTNPPGALVELPPRKPLRGREQDNLFILVTPADQQHAQASLYEQLAQTIATDYFGTSGSVTSGLREAITRLNTSLVDQNVVGGQSYTVGVTCVVMRGKEIYIARAGDSILLLRLGDQSISLPPAHNESFRGTSLGSGPVIDIKLARYQIHAGDVLLMADTGLRTCERDKLDQALAMGAMRDILDTLKPLMPPLIQTMLVVFTGLDAPDPALLNPSQGIRPLHGTLTSTRSTPAAKSRQRDQSRLTASSAEAEGTAPASTPFSALKSVRSLPIFKSTPARVTPNTSAEPLSPAVNVPEVLPIESPASATTPTEVAEKVNPFRTVPITLATTEMTPLSSITSPTVAVPSQGNAIEEDGDMDTDVDAAVQSSSAASAPTKVSSSPALGKLANGLDAASRGLTRLLDKLLPEASQDGPRVPSMLVAGMGILIPVIIVFVVVALRLNQVDMSQFEQMIRDVQQAAQEAENFPLTDKLNARTAWMGVMQRIEQVETTTGRTNDPILVSIKAKAQGILDQFSQVTRRQVIPLRDFGNGAVLIGPIVRAKTDMYTLDVKNNGLWYDRLNSSNQTLFRRSSAPVVQQGSAVGAYTAQQFIDMVWMTEGSVQNTVVVLDRQGILISYSPVFAPADSRKLAGTDLLVSPKAMFAWRDRLYVLDPGANQIWRYTPVGKTYPNPPDAYFEQDAVDISQAVDLGIDRNGIVYILFSNGEIHKYLGGEEQSFTYSGMPDDALKHADALYMDADGDLPAIYVIDKTDHSIYQITLSGKFLYRFRANDATAFKDISSLYVDGDSYYVAAGDALYYFSTSDLPKLGPSATTVPPQQ